MVTQEDNLTENNTEPTEDNTHPIAVTNQSFGPCCYNTPEGRCQRLGRNPFSVYLTTLWGLTDTYYCARHRSYAVRLERTLLRDYLRMKEERLRNNIESHMPELCETCKETMGSYFVKYVPLVNGLGDLKQDIDEILMESKTGWDNFVGSDVNGSAA